MERLCVFNYLRCLCTILLLWTIVNRFFVINIYFGSSKSIPFIKINTILFNYIISLNSRLYNGTADIIGNTFGFHTCRWCYIFASQYSHKNSHQYDLKIISLPCVDLKITDSGNIPHTTDLSMFFVC